MAFNVLQEKFGGRSEAPETALHARNKAILEGLASATKRQSIP